MGSWPLLHAAAGGGGGHTDQQPSTPRPTRQVMDDWDARSTLYRIMSLDAFNPPSPQQHQARGGLLSPAAAALFSPVAGGAGGGAGGPPPLVGMPSGEVHMDEIDLMECIGKGGYG